MKLRSFNANKRAIGKVLAIRRAGYIRPVFPQEGRSVVTCGLSSLERTQRLTIRVRNSLPNPLKNKITLKLLGKTEETEASKERRLLLQVEKNEIRTFNCPIL